MLWGAAAAVRAGRSGQWGAHGDLVGEEAALEEVIPRERVRVGEQGAHLTTRRAQAKLSGCCRRTVADGLDDIHRRGRLPPSCVGPPCRRVCSAYSARGLRTAIANLVCGAPADV